MYENSSLLALIPARGGSKGLPNKNILECAGKPLIQWTISAALDVNLIDDVLVSTDSVEIAEIAKRAGASVPFLRPKELATDDSSIVDSIKHAWKNHLDSRGRRYDYVVLLQPTSPLRTAAHIKNAIDFYFGNRRSDDDVLASVYQIGKKYAWLMQRDDDSQYIRFCLNINSNNPQRQQLNSYYLPNGAIFIARGASLVESLYGDNTLAFVMDASDSADIDTSGDLKDAETILLRRQRPA